MQRAQKHLQYNFCFDFRVRIDEQGNLVIESASKLDQGRYQCSASNLAATRDSRPVRLRVHGEYEQVNRKPESHGRARTVLCSVSLVWEQNFKL